MILYLRSPRLACFDLALALQESLLFFVIIITSFKSRPPINHEETYGEVTYFALSKVFSLPLFNQTRSICDLGSGKGKILAYARLMHGFDGVGIELRSSLSKLSKRLLSLLFINRVTIMTHDFCTIELPESDVFLITSTCLSDQTLSHVCDRISHLSSPPVVISITVPLPLAHYEIYKTMKLPCSWGFDLFYIQRPKMA